MSTKDTLSLIAPPTMSAILDGTLTLLGQPVGYLSGVALTVHELNPLAHYLLATSPIAFAVGVALWVLSFNLMITRVPEKLGAMISLFICFAHLVGVSTWVMQFSYGILWVCVLWLFARFVLYTSYQHHFVDLSCDASGTT